MKDILKRHHISFKLAWAGIVWAFKTQPNFRIHLVLSAAAIIAGIFFGISRLEMTVIIFTIILGLTAEMVNTSLEAMTDLITTEWRASAKIAKDVSAGMMLMTATGALVVAIIIFWPYILVRFFQ